jgi:hypothetical protein
MAGFSIAGALMIGCSVLVAPPTPQFRTKGSGFHKKAVVDKNHGNGYYQISFLETGGYRQREIPGAISNYHRSYLKPYSYGADHELSMEPVEEVEDEQREMADVLQELENEADSNLEIDVEEIRKQLESSQVDGDSQEKEFHNGSQDSEMGIAKVSEPPAEEVRLGKRSLRQERMKKRQKTLISYEDDE